MRADGRRYTYDDLADDIRDRIEGTARGEHMMRESIVLLRMHGDAAPDEWGALERGLRAAEAISDRVAARALTALKTLRHRGG